MNIYLEIEAGTGTCFQRSKEPQEGYEMYQGIDPSTQEVKTSYRKYFKDGVFGLLKSIDVRETEFKGKKQKNIVTILVDGDDKYFITMPLYNQKGNIQDYAVSLISFMPALEIDVAYRFYPFAIKNDNSDRKNYGVAINYALLPSHPDGPAVDKDNKIPKLQQSYNKKNESGGWELIVRDYPETIFKTVGDKIKPDNDNRDNFLYKVMMDNKTEYSGGSGVKTFNSKAGSTTAPDQKPTAPDQKPTATEESAPKKEASSTTGMAPNTAFDKKPENTAAAVTSEEEDDDDDLPF